LISQALANLVENAIKYGKPVAGGAAAGADAPWRTIAGRS
jgi:signal transduction histidine kinase